MEILSFDTLDSTQAYMLDKLHTGEIDAATAGISAEQTHGVGSRENSWEGGRGNFFASVALKCEDLPKDLPAASASIYFAFLMKKALLRSGLEVWLKWPNDLYKAEKKVGGVITKKLSHFVVVGMALICKKIKMATAP